MLLCRLTPLLVAASVAFFAASARGEPTAPAMVKTPVSAEDDPFRDEAPAKAPPKTDKPKSGAHQKKLAERQADKERAARKAEAQQNRAHVAAQKEREAKKAAKARKAFERQQQAEKKRRQATRARTRRTSRRSPPSASKSSSTSVA